MLDKVKQAWRHAKFPQNVVLLVNAGMYVGFSEREKKALNFTCKSDYQNRNKNRRSDLDHSVNNQC